MCKIAHPIPEELPVTTIYTCCSVACHNLVATRINATEAAISEGCGGCGAAMPDIGQKGRLHRCPRCEAVPYCSRACMRDHWKSHKKVCNRNGGFTVAAVAAK
jgi:hypothetical protein